MHDLLNKWRHTAYLEMRDPGAHYQMLAKAALIMRTGHNPDPVSFEIGNRSVMRRDRRAISGGQIDQMSANGAGAGAGM
ncbi:MAG: DUF6247 family protein [Pseudonocardiaceae bacterium]